MHVNLSRLELLVNFGFKQDPFKIDFQTADRLRIRRLLKPAIKSRAIVSIVAERGCGKTKTVYSELKELDVQQVVVRTADKQRLLITDIEQAMILDLSDEKPKRGREIRARQLRRIIGQASRKRSIVVVIEEAHTLHGMTLRALKGLRELDWMGETELFTVILIGQSDPMNKAGMSEIRLRSNTVFMHGLTASETEGYIHATVGGVFAEDAAKAVSALPDASNFLDLQNILATLMGSAFVSGREAVTHEDIEDVYGIKPDSKKQKDRKTGKQLMHESGNDKIRTVLSRRPVEDNGSKSQAVG